MEFSATDLIIRFCRSRRGNVAVLFAFTLVPMLLAVGCAVDYGHATQVRSKLQSAIDAASVGSVARASRAYAQAATMTADGALDQGVADAKNIFAGNVANLPGYETLAISATVTKTAQNITSALSFSAVVQTAFLGIMGVNSMTVTGTSTSVATLPSYIDFYLLLDNSPSMGVGATTTDVDTMVKNTPDGCAFACHDLNNASNYYIKAKSLGVMTRIDVLRSATMRLMDTATSTRVSSTQFRMAIYDFGASAATTSLRALYSLSSDLSAAKTAAGNIDLMTVNGQNQNNDQDTNFTTILPAMNSAITAPGNGATGAPQKYLFFVSDGVADEYNPGSCIKPTTNGRCQSPLNPALCTALKNRGIKIAVLYTTYLALPTNDWYKQWIAPFNAGPYGPSPNSEIASNMQSCASPGLYFEVSMTQGISEAMTALFQKAIADARISS